MTLTYLENALKLPYRLKIMEAVVCGQVW